VERVIHASSLHLNTNQKGERGAEERQRGKSQAWGEEALVGMRACEKTLDVSFL